MWLPKVIIQNWGWLEGAITGTLESKADLCNLNYLKKNGTLIKQNYRYSKLILKQRSSLWAINGIR